LAERADGIDTELALTLTTLWNRSNEEQRETIRLNYPKWKPGDLNVFFKWSEINPADIDTTDPESNQ